MFLKVPSRKWRPFRLGLNVLSCNLQANIEIIHKLAHADMYMSTIAYLRLFIEPQVHMIIITHNVKHTSENKLSEFRMHTHTY